MQGKTSPNMPSLAHLAIAFGVAVIGGLVCYGLLGLGRMGSLLVGIVLFILMLVVLGMTVAGAAPVAEAPATKPAPAPKAAPVAAAVAPAAPPATAAKEPDPVAEPATPAPATATADTAEKPRMLTAARDGGPDDLKLIKGVGPKLETTLHRMGVFHFDQIAAWTGNELAWVDDNLEGFKGRASRDQWVAQAQVLAAGGSTDFSRRNDH